MLDHNSVVTMCRWLTRTMCSCLQCASGSNRMPDREAKPCVRANFKGPFQFPQDGFEPYGGIPTAH